MEGAKQTKATRKADPERASHRGRKSDPAKGLETTEVACYLAKLLPELATLAERADMNVACYLLRMAGDEAREHLRQNGGGTT